MRLLNEFIFKPFIKWVFRGVKGVSMWIIRQTIMFIRFALPHALRLVLSSLGWAVRLSILGGITAFKGVSVADQLAEHWQMEALAHGFPMIWERPLFSILRVLAVFTIVLGWLLILFTGLATGAVAYQLITKP